MLDQTTHIALPSQRNYAQDQDEMAFLTSTAIVTRGAFTRPALNTRFGGRAVAVRTSHSRVSAPKVQPRMETDWTGPAPPSSVLGIGKDVASGTFIAGSVAAFVLGVYCCYQSNLFSPLTADTVNPLYVLGSLGLPISWGCHVAG